MFWGDHKEKKKNSIELNDKVYSTYVRIQMIWNT